MKKVLAIIFAVVLLIQAGALTVFAENAEENEKVITISDINFTSSEDSSSTLIRMTGLPSDAVEILSEEWSCPDEIVISGENIEITDGKYSYKLVLRSNGTLTFDNDLEIYYQGINGRYQLNYEIDETDNHIMVVTGNFENIIIESPLLDKLSDKSKNWIVSHISEDTYFYQLVLRTAEGFTFTNCLRFLFDSEPKGYTLDYTYDLLTDEQSLIINGIGDPGEPETAAAETEEAEQVSEQASDGFELIDATRIVKAGKTTLGAWALDKGAVFKTYSIKEVNNKKYAGFFTINKLTGSIKVNPRTPRGRYVVTVQAQALKTKICKTANVTIIVI